MHTINGHIIVELPEGASNITVTGSTYSYKKPKGVWDIKMLPSGNYEYLCTLQEALDNEELAGSICKEMGGYYEIEESEEFIIEIYATNALKDFAKHTGITNPSSWIVLKRS